MALLANAEDVQDCLHHLESGYVPSFTMEGKRQSYNLVAVEYTALCCVVVIVSGGANAIAKLLCL